MLTIREFKKSYGPRLILEIEHLELGPGIHWITGENGAGKSTLFRSLAGMIPWTGRAAFDDGIEHHRHPAAFRRRVTFSDAEPAYPAFLSPRDLFSFTASARLVPAGIRQYYLRLFGVDQFSDSPFETCSSGMLKKVSLALSFLGSPSLQILDEPFNALDAETRVRLCGELARIRAGGSRIVLMSSHQNVAIEGLDPDVTLTVRNGSIQKG